MFNPKKIQTITYMPGEYILREGANCDALFIVKEEQIKIFRMDAQKNKIPVGLVALTRGLVFKLHRTNDVLKGNGIVDESLSAAVKAIQEKEKSAA